MTETRCGCYGYTGLALPACEGIAAGLEDALAALAGSNPTAHQAAYRYPLQQVRVPINRGP
jgi:hypothetical protein